MFSILMVIPVQPLSWREHRWRAICVWRCITSPTSLIKTSRIGRIVVSSVGLTLGTGTFLALGFTTLGYICRTYSFLSVFIAENQGFEGADRDPDNIMDTLHTKHYIIRNKLKCIELIMLILSCEQRGGRGWAATCASAHDRAA